MRSSTLQGVLQHLRKLTDPHCAKELCDADLLERFRRDREESAFTLLVQRHGAMVWSVCRRILGDEHEAEDAFQATFLALVRKAGTIRRDAALASWLHVVATHLAFKARRLSARRRACEREIIPPNGNVPCDDALTAGELRAALDEEIARLPDKYRTPLVLCYLSEKTHEQAAGELGWPKSSVTARLAKARELLQRRLTRRGFTVPAGLLAVLLTENTTNAAAPSLLTLSTVRQAVQALSSKTVTASSAAALASGFLKRAATLKVVGALVLLAALGFALVPTLRVGTHLGTLGVSPFREGEADRDAERRSLAFPRGAWEREAEHEPRVDLLGDELPEEALARMGSSRLRHPGLRDLLFSPDGKSLISINEGGLRIWDAATGKLLRNLSRRSDIVEDGQVKSCRLVGDSLVRALLNNGEENNWRVTVQVIDAANGQACRRVRIKDTAYVANPTISPNGKRVAVAQKNEIRLYDTTTGDKLVQIPVKGVAAWDMAFSLDSKTIAHNDLSSGSIYLHDVATGKRIREMKRPGDATLHLVFSPDGRFLASMPQSRIAQKGEVSLWNVQEGKEVHRWTHPFPHAMSAAFSPDGKRIAIGGARWGLVLRDVDTGKEVRRFSPHGGVYHLAFSADGKILATASPQGAIRLWDTATGKILPESADPNMQFVSHLRFSADGKRLFGETGACLIWDTATGRELRRISDPKPLDLSHPNDMRRLCLSSDGSLLAAANSDGTITLWDAATGKEKRVLKAHDRFAWNLIFSPDSRKLISNGSDGWVRVWDVATGRQLHQFHGQTPLTVSLDNRYLATGDAKTAAVFVHELTTGRETKRFSLGTNGYVHQIAFSSDSGYLAAVGYPNRGSDIGTAKVWDVASGRLLLSLERPKSNFSCVSFSPDGKSVATGAGNRSLLLWELASGRQRHAFVGHEDGIISLAFSTDGKSLAASSVDAPVYIWDVAGVLDSKPRRLSKEELQRCWTALAGEDAVAAFQTIRRLAAVPDRTPPFLRDYLQPVSAPDLKRVRQLVEMLDSADFPTRQKAAEELENRADAASGLLRQILAKEKPSLEVRRRLQQIVESIEKKPETLRAVRAVEVLEWIGTPDAVRLLGQLADGAADARLTQTASAARRRLRR